MKRKRRISRLMREIKRLRKEIKQLHDKHWEECRSVSEQPTKKQKTYKEDFLEKFPDAKCSLGDSVGICRYNVYNNVDCGKYNFCRDCWNEVMPDE